ncbi:MAG: ferric reductase-like transmembrane domain-containing protein [Acholeplasmataceae bacterium]
MTIILSTTIIFSLLGYFFSKQIRKYALYVYAFFALIALIIGSQNANIISLGYVPFGIFLLVMYMGILDKGKFKNQLLGVRGEFAIIGTILLIPHAVGYLGYYFDFVGFWTGTASFYIGIVAVLVLAPLSLTSFRKVKSKLGYKKWKKTHYFSYLFYVLIGLHLTLMHNDRFWFYIIIFGFYIVLKSYMLIKTYRIKKIKNKN